MPVAIVTGSGGLVGSQAVSHLVEAGFDVIGLENDGRARFFGPEASTAPVTAALRDRFSAEFRSLDLDVRDASAVERVVAVHGKRIEILVHTAAQPSHDWAARDPHTDFHVNATGTLNLLEATRRHAPGATFVHCSTSKVYGDTPNRLPLIEVGSRLDLPRHHPYWHGIDAAMSIDASLHSLFGVSKAAADLLVQEYGRYFGMPTACFRPGCLTGSAHAGTRDHGFLSYLMRCVVREERYTVFGYDGLQVRCNLHASDLIGAVAAFHASPRAGAVYNIGGGRSSSCSVLEAIALAEEISGRMLDWSLSPAARTGDHRWWISDNRPFQADYPGWRPEYELRQILQEIHDANAERWLATA
jgi:CDP-paratose 2-epimerase